MKIDFKNNRPKGFNNKEDKFLIPLIKMKLPAASSGELTPKEIRTYDVGKISPADLNGLLFHLTQTLTIFSLNRYAACNDCQKNTDILVEYTNCIYLCGINNKS